MLGLVPVAAFIIVGVAIGCISGFIAGVIKATILAEIKLADNIMAILDLFNPNFYLNIDKARPKLLNNKISGSTAEIHNSIIKKNILIDESYTLLNNTAFINNTIENSTGILSKNVNFENNILTGNNTLTFIDYNGNINIKLSADTESLITLNNISGSTIKNISYDDTILGNEYTVIINTKDDSTIENININPYKDKDKDLTNIEAGTMPMYGNALYSVNSIIKDSDLLVSQLNSDNSTFTNTNIIISNEDQQVENHIKLINTTIENKPLTFLNANTRTLDIERAKIEQGIKLINSDITINAINENTLSNIQCIYTTSTPMHILIIGTPGKQTFENFSINVKNINSDNIRLNVNLQDVTCKTFTLDGRNNCNCNIGFDISNLTCEILNIKNYQQFNMDDILLSIKECNAINISNIDSLTFNISNTQFINTGIWLFGNNSNISIKDVNSIDCYLQGIKGLKSVNIDVLSDGSVYLDNVGDGAYTINGITSFSIINSPSANVLLDNIKEIPSLHIKNHKLAEDSFDGTDKNITLYGTTIHPLKGSYTDCSVGRILLEQYIYKLLSQFRWFKYMRR